MRKNGTVEIPTIVKWAGGKSQLLKQFELFFPKKIDFYIEPFLGSGAVFFYIQRKYKPKKIILSDTNEELINAVIMVRDKVGTLIEHLKKHKEQHNKEYYYNRRALDSSALTDIERAARFIYLNKTCFNGLYRVNSKGKFNVPIGSYKNPGILKEDVLMAASKLLQDVKIKVMPFENILDRATKDAFIYFDPPYCPLKKTSFTTYTKEVFLEEEQKKLADVFKALDKKGCEVMLSNSDTKFVRDLYAGFNVCTVQAKRFINSKAEGRGSINELVIRNY